MAPNIEVNKKFYVTTSNGTYYQGMKKSEAEKNNSYKRMCGIDFAYLDKNGDGVLSEKEISEGQRSQGTRDGITIGLMSAGTGLQVGAGVSVATGLGAPAAPVLSGAGLGCTFLGFLFNRIF